MDGMIVNSSAVGPAATGPTPTSYSEDTVRGARCGCVPQLGLLYEDVGQGGGDSQGKAPGWARKIPLFGPLWCVSGATGTTKVRRRDNAVYRSNSFKYERKSPNFGIKLKTLDPPPPEVKQKNTVVTPPPVQDLRINLNYSDPQDAELLQGAFNPAFQGDCDVEERVALTKVCLGGDIYYCKPYQPFHTQLRYNFSDLQESGVDNDSEYELMPSSHKNNNGSQHDCNACVTVISVCPSPARGAQCAGIGGCVAQSRSTVSQVSTHESHSPPVNGKKDESSVFNRMTTPDTPMYSKVQAKHNPFGMRRASKPNLLMQKRIHQSHENIQSDYNPTYENLSFHKVTINVPDHLQQAVHAQAHEIERKNVHRNLPVRKSKVPLKYQGIKRIKSKAKIDDTTSATATAGATASQSRDAKNGYSQKEVWNWLHLDENDATVVCDGRAVAGSRLTVVGVADSEHDVVVDGDQLCCESPPGGEEDGKAGVSVQFSPAEFLSATTRLAHLDLEGFERFVGNTFDRAIAGAKAGRTKSSDLVIDHERVKHGVDKCEVEVDQQTQLEDCGADTDTYVWKDTCRSRQTCLSCLKSGVSSCSSALSSLESGGSRETNTSRDTSGSGLSRETSGSGLSRDTSYGDVHDSDSGHPASTGGHEQHVGSVGGGGAHHYLKMTAGGRVSRLAKVPAYASVIKQVHGPGVGAVKHHAGGSVASGGGIPFSTKPYQTLEVNLDDNCCLPGGVRIDKRLGLELVDPSIQLHQQEWYHGNVSRQEAEVALRLASPGSYLVRNSESTSKDYSLSLKSTHGFMHMRIQQTPDGQYILGQFSRPFPTIPHMINYYTVNKLPIRGAEHVSLKRPLCEQLL